MGEQLVCTGPSFWIQWASFFLWSWQLMFCCTRLKVPSDASEDSNCSNTFTICQNSGLLSGCKDQHRSINARIAGGQSAGIIGLKFWKKIIIKAQELSVRFYMFNNFCLMKIRTELEYRHIGQATTKQKLKTNVSFTSNFNSWSKK